MVTIDKKEFSVKKTTVQLDYPLSTPILTQESFFSNTYIIELARGCPFSCKFCLASHLNKPYRCASTDGILQEIDKGLQYTNRIAFLGALISLFPLNWVQNSLIKVHQFFMIPSPVLATNIVVFVLFIVAIGFGALGSYMSIKKHLQV